MNLSTHWLYGATEVLGQVAIYINQHLLRWGSLNLFVKWSPQDLGFPDELGQLLNLGFGGHVHILVSNTDDHAAQD